MKYQVYFCVNEAAEVNGSHSKMCSNQENLMFGGLFLVVLHSSVK